jgi:glycosyltransferase involved in cell wall biosynthesis
VSVKTRFRILHCLRAPVGGLFRHVCDLATAQSALGHEVAVVCADDGNPLTIARLDDLAPALKLGLHRLPMGREVGLADFKAARAVSSLAKSINIDIIHGHGAKGGAYARLAARKVRTSGTKDLACIYTPHGGSLHYAPTTLKGRLYMAAERHLAIYTDALIFESAYSGTRFATHVRRSVEITRVIPNGVAPQEFAPIVPAPDASDFLFIGELRTLKGVDILLDALAVINRSRKATATIVGAGPDAPAFRARAAMPDLAGCVTFPGAMPARNGFKLGRTLIIPSRAESFPYIVLEAAAAAMPIIATRVGGIPEITAATDTPLIEPENVTALVGAMNAALDNPAHHAARAQRLQARIAAKFTVDSMTTAVLGVYRETLSH